MYKNIVPDYYQTCSNYLILLNNFDTDFSKCIRIFDIFAHL